MTETASQICQQVDTRARERAVQEGADNPYPYIAGGLEAEVDRLARELEQANRRLANEQSENRRLEVVERAASDLVDAMGKAERRHRYGPLTTEEIRDAEAHLTDVLEQDADGNK